MIALYLPVSPKDLVLLEKVLTQALDHGSELTLEEAANLRLILYRVEMKRKET